MRDLIAGVTLASMNIPQVLGYTRIAGTPVVTGLYTVLLPLVAFAAFGSSRHLVVAADSATAAIFSSSLSTMAPALSEKYMALVGMVALLTAGFLLLARILKLGFLADFLSRTVLVGFLTGVGIQVGIAMLGDMLGVAIQSHRTLVQAWEVLRGLPHLDIPTAALSVLVAGSIFVGHRLTPRLPVALFAVVGTIAASAAFDFAGHGIAIIGPVPGGLPSIAIPEVSWRETLALIPVAASCFVVIIAQSAATARVFALRYRERVDENADILGLSAANAVAAVSGAFVVNGSPTQRHVRHSYRPHTMVLEFDAAGEHIALPATPGMQTEPGIVVYRFGADLFYANDHRFTDEVRTLVAHAPTPVRWFVVDAEAITDLDYSAARSIHELLDDLARQKVGMMFARVGPYLRSDMDRHGVTAALGETRVFTTLHEAIAAARDDLAGAAATRR
jgi:MFS superfamily sulfate permease-like transporter